MPLSVKWGRMLPTRDLVVTVCRMMAMVCLAQCLVHGKPLIKILVLVIEAQVGSCCLWLGANIQLDAETPKQGHVRRWVRKARLRSPLEKS